MNTFEIRAKGKTEADVFIYGDIGASWDEESVTAAKFVRDLQNVDAQTINVRLNSYGGAVSDALAIYNALARHPATVNTHVDGVAISAASLIAMAGKTMTMAENAMLMIHGPMAMAGGNAKDMRAMADVLDKYAQAMAPSYAAKTGKPAADMLALLTDGVDHWFTASEAKDAGFADEVSAAIPVAASFDLRRFRGVPAAAAAFQRSMTMPEITPAAPTPAAPQSPQAVLPLAPAAPQSVAPAAPVLAVVTNPRTNDQVAEIRAAFQPFMKREGIAAVYTAILEDQNMTVEAARAQLLTALGKDAAPANPTGMHIQMGETDAEKFRAAAAISIAARAGGQYVTAKERETLGQNPYRGHKLLDIARAALERAGVNTRGMGQMDIVASAFTQSTSDFPVLLENTMHKALQSAYAIQPNTWSRFCARGSVSDFRAHNRYRTGSFGNLDTVNENGEFKNKAIPDGEKASITATTKGNIINLSRQMVINDDLGAFVGLSAALGRAAARTVEADVYALLAENSGAGPTMTDTGILFNTTAITTAGGHANRLAYAAPTVALLDGARQAMMLQMDPSQNDYLSLVPAVAVCRPTLTATFKILNGAVYDPTAESNKAQNKPNAVAGIVQDIVDSPRITWNAWYLFADPNIAPVIEVAFLDGNDVPFLDQQTGFTVDGTQYKVRLDYGVNEIDYRGAYGCVGS